MRVTVLVGVVLIAAAGWSCSDSPSPTSPTVTNGGGGGGNGAFTILILGGGDDTFRPGQVTITQGSSVSWMNSDSDDTIHRIVAADGSFDTGDLAAQDQGAPIVPGAGTVGYRCAIHAEEEGTITVNR